MIPGDAGEDSYMRVVPKEFGTQVERTGQILISFKDGVLGSIAEAYHSFEALYLRTYHIIGFNTEALKHIEDHRSGGRLTVRAAYDNTDLVLGLLVQVFGEGIDLEAQFPCFYQFGVVFASMHTEDNCIYIFGDALGVPTHLIG